MHLKVPGSLLVVYCFRRLVQYAVLTMAAVLTLVFISGLVSLEADMGKAKTKPKFKQIFSKSESVNILSGLLACMFLFGARDVWFVDCSADLSRQRV